MRGCLHECEQARLVYGASGYTGRLVCEYLRDLNVPFIAAGRAKARVQEVIDKVPGIAVEHDVVVDYEVAALTELFRGAKVVSNMVGTFIKYGPQAVAGALASACQAFRHRELLGILRSSGLVMEPILTVHT